MQISFLSSLAGILRRVNCSLTDTHSIVLPTSCKAPALSNRFDWERRAVGGSLDVQRDWFEKAKTLPQVATTLPANEKRP